MLAALLIVLAGALVVFLVVGGGQCLALIALEPIGFALPLLACAIFLAAPQMADMVVGMTAGYGVNGVYEVAWWHQLGLGCGVLALGFQGWFWSRAALNARRHWRDIDAPPGMPWQERWAPRLTLLPTTLIAVSPSLMWLAGKLPTAGIPWLGVALAVLVSIGLIWLATRRRIQHEAHVRGVLNLAAQTGAAVQPPPTLYGPRVKQLFEAAPWGPRIAWLLLLVGVIGCVIAQAAPDFVNDRLHTLTAALLALSCVVPIGTIALALCRDVVELLLYGLRRIIVWAMGQAHVPGTPPPSAIQGMTDWFGLALLIVLPIGASFVTQDFRLYEVLPAQNTAADLVAARPTLDDAVSRYNKCHEGETGKIPAIIVAAEGGASRSAVWTLSVMRMLDAETGGQFGSHLFAITSVSGGSLGAVTYALAQAKNLLAPQRAPTPAEQRKFWDKARNGLVELGRADLLSSGIARMFTSDLMLGVPSRGPALERAFEHHWRSSDGLGLSKDDADTGLLKLYASHPCLPHLLLNGTDVASGTRLVTSTIRFELLPEPFPATADVLYGQQSDIKPASAVLNSARFPLISPPGDLPRNLIDGKVPYIRRAHGNRWWRIRELWCAHRVGAGAGVAGRTEGAAFGTNRRAG